MKRILPFLLTLIACSFSTLILKAQIIMHGGDTTVFKFDGTDSLVHRMPYPYISGAATTITIDTSHADTVNTRLWQIGGTLKAFFADTDRVAGIMTDTTNNYPVNANSWFKITINIPIRQNFFMLEFTHKYQTDSGRDGGIVEYSLDNGVSWDNVHGTACPNTISFENFYAATDTIIGGDPAFSGSSQGWVTSAFQLPGVMLTRTTGCNFYTSNIIVRFRFQSDTTIDTLAGWLIKNITVRPYLPTGGVVEVNNAIQQLNVYPNPSTNGLFNFPILDNEHGYTITVSNILGQVMLQTPYVHVVDIAAQSSGIYFYKVTDGQTQYSGKLSR